MPCIVQCVPVQSRWVNQVILTTDCTLAVWFKDGYCCEYLATSAAWFNRMLAAPSKGHFVRQFLYPWPHRPIRPPCPAVGRVTACCPTVGLPDRLHCTVTNVSGCGCLAGSYPVDFDPHGGSFGDAAWVYNGTACGLALKITAECIGPPFVWALTIQLGMAAPSFHADAGSGCEPFVQNFQANPFTYGAGCTGSVTATVTL